MTTIPPKTAADLLNEVGPGLAGRDEWIEIPAAAGIAQKDTLCSVRRGHATYRGDHPFLVRLLAYAEQRTNETKQARDAIKA